MIYEITGAGFDAATDDTDQLVFWVEADGPELAQQIAEDCGAKFWGQIEPTMATACIDYVLPRQALALQEALLQCASDFRNRNRA